jgi:hypothetical protein
MSAWMHGNYHLSVVVNTIYKEGRGLVPKGAPATAEEAFLWLRKDNARSIAARYVHLGEAVEANEAQCGDYLSITDIVDDNTLKMAIASIEYQSCEHPEWADGAAHIFLDGVLRAIAQVAGETEYVGYDADKARNDAWSMKPPAPSDLSATAEVHHDGRMTREDMISEMVSGEVSDLADLARRDYEEFEAQVGPLVLAVLVEELAGLSDRDTAHVYLAQMGTKPAGW